MDWQLHRRDLDSAQRVKHKYEHDALQEIHRRLFESNTTLEVRDVRLPTSTHHPSLIRLAKCVETGLINRALNRISYSFAVTQIHITKTKKYNKEFEMFNNPTY